MKFDRLEHSKKFVTCPGERFKESFHGVLGDDGYITLVSDGYIDTQRQIEADAVGADVKSIIQRALQGDMSVFRDDKAFYGDVAEMPKTYAEILNIVNQAHREFDMLPLDVKEKYNGDFDRWFSQIGTDEWLKNLGLVKDETASEQVEEKGE